MPERSALTDPQPSDVLRHARTNQWAVDITRFTVRTRDGDRLTFTVDDGDNQIPMSVADWAKSRAGCEVILLGREDHA